jgi:hypothetical protein
MKNTGAAPPNTVVQNMVDPNTVDPDPNTVDPDPNTVASPHAAARPAPLGPPPRRRPEVPCGAAPPLPHPSRAPR